MVGKAVNNYLKKNPNYRPEGESISHWKKRISKNSSRSSGRSSSGRSSKKKNNIPSNFKPTGTEVMTSVGGVTMLPKEQPFTPWNKYAKIDNYNIPPSKPSKVSGGRSSGRSSSGRSSRSSTKTRVSGKEVKQSRVNRNISRDKGEIKLIGGGTLYYSKAEAGAKYGIRKPRLIFGDPTGLNKKRMAEYESKIKQKVVEDFNRQRQEEGRITKSKLESGKQTIWVSPSGKPVVTRGGTPFGMREDVALRRGYTKVNPERVIKTEKGLAIKPETRTPEQTLKEIRKGNLSVIPTASLAFLGNKNIKDIYSGKIPTGKIGVNDYTVMKTKDIPKMAKTLSPAEVTIYKGSLMTSKQAKRLYEATPEYATKIGKMALAEMNKKGTLEEFKGLVASGMRPWATEVAGTQIAESLHQVKKGTAQKLLIQRLGEDIIQTKKEGITFGGFIKRLAEAPESVIGAPIVTAGMGSAFVGVRGALASQSVKLKNAFDITMAGLGGWWAGSRAGKMAVAEHFHDRPKLISLGLQTMAELGGATIGAGMVTASTPKGKPVNLKPKNVLKANVKTLKTKTMGELNTGKIKIGMETPKGKTVSVKAEFKATTKGGVTRGYIKIPKQKVGEMEIKPQRIALKQNEIENIISYGKKTFITKPTKEPLYLKVGKKVGEIVEPKGTTYQPYNEIGLPLEKKVTFIEKKGLPKAKVKLLEQTQKVDKIYNQIVNKYLRGGKPTEAQLRRPKDMDIIKRLNKYKIEPKKTMELYGEKGQIETREGSKIIKRTAIGKTEGGTRYGIEEVSMKYEPTTLEKIHLQVTKNIDKAYNKAVSKKTIPESAKKIAGKPEKPINNIDKIYRDVPSNVNKHSKKLFKPRVQEEPAEPSKVVGKIIRQVGKMKIKTMEKPVKSKITKLLPKRIAPPMPTIFEDITRNMEQDMARVINISQTSRTRIKPEKMEIIQKVPETIVPIQIVDVDKDYQTIQNNIGDTF